jgi:AraC-like DNA-binding protein
MDRIRILLEDIRMSVTRREGFPGEKLLVLPEQVLQRQARDPLLSGLLVARAGYFPNARGHFVERPLGCGDTVLILVLGGRGKCRLGAAEWQAVEAGALLWLPVGEAHAYGSAMPDSDWKILWCHVRGSELTHWAAFFGFNHSEPVFQADLTPPTVNHLHAVWQAIAGGYARADCLQAACSLRSFFTAFRRDVLFQGPRRSAAERVSEVARLFSERLQEPHRLDAAAAAAGLSVPHFIEVFKRLYDSPPMEYLLRVRISEACRLLLTSPLSVQAIGEQVGFADAAYFSRQFRAVMALSPAAYRRQMRS